MQLSVAAQLAAAFCAVAINAWPQPAVSTAAHRVTNQPGEWHPGRAMQQLEAKKMEIQTARFHISPLFPNLSNTEHSNFTNEIKLQPQL